MVHLLKFSFTSYNKAQALILYSGDCEIHFDDFKFILIAYSFLLLLFHLRAKNVTQNRVQKLIGPALFIYNNIPRTLN